MINLWTPTGEREGGQEKDFSGDKKSDIDIINEEGNRNVGKVHVCCVITRTYGLLHNS